MEDITKTAKSRDGDVIKLKTSVTDTGRKTTILIPPGGAAVVSNLSLHHACGTKEEMRATEGKVKHKRGEDLVRQ